MEPSGNADTVGRVEMVPLRMTPYLVGVEHGIACWIGVKFCGPRGNRNLGGGRLNEEPRTDVVQVEMFPSKIAPDVEGIGHGIACWSGGKFCGHRSSVGLGESRLNAELHPVFVVHVEVFPSKTAAD